jgi:hypothetical protein
MIRRVGSVALVLLTVCGFMWACDQSPGRSGDDAGDDVSVTADASDAQQASDSGLSDVDIIIRVDGSGDCGPLATDAGPKQMRECCHGVICEGFCFLADDGGSYCGCGYIRGGCADGQICCAFTSSTCTLTENCGHFP